MQKTAYVPWVSAALVALCRARGDRAGPSFPASDSDNDAQHHTRRDFLFLAGGGRVPRCSVPLGQSIEPRIRHTRPTGLRVDAPCSSPGTFHHADIFSRLLASNRPNEQSREWNAPARATHVRGDAALGVRAVSLVAPALVPKVLSPRSLSASAT